MSRFSTFCDAVIEDLVANVPEMEGVRFHRYAPWDPEQLEAENGERHLAIHPAADAADETTPLVTGPGGDLFVSLYRVSYWEHAGDESSRGIADERAAFDMYELLDKLIARFYAIENVFLGGTELTKYIGTTLPERSGSVRWFQLTVRARSSLVMT